VRGVRPGATELGADAEAEPPALPSLPLLAPLIEDGEGRDEEPLGERRCARALGCVARIGRRLERLKPELGYVPSDRVEVDELLR
jgi:hypothetical protein